MSQLPTVTSLVQLALALSSGQHGALHRQWIDLSFALGGRLPKSLMCVSIQRLGRLDMMLRTMEAEFLLLEGEAQGMAGEPNVMLAEIWVGAAYEIVRVAQELDLAPEANSLTTLAHHLRLLRIPMEKYQIAADKTLLAPLELERANPREGESPFIYSKDDPKRSHIMPSGISARGSSQWHVIDVKAQKAYWLERRDLSDRMLALLPVLREIAATTILSPIDDDASDAADPAL